MSINVGQVQPDFNAPPYLGTFQQLLSLNIGRMVKVDYLQGTNSIASQSGKIYAVGVQYLVLEQLNGTYQVGDIFSIKSMTFY